MYNECWNRYGIDKSKRYASDCLFEILKKRFGIENDPNEEITNVQINLDTL